MSRIQISDLNPSDVSFLSELTDEEIICVSGGFWLDFGFLRTVVEYVICVQAHPNGPTSGEDCVCCHN